MNESQNPIDSPNVLPFRQATQGCERMTEFLPWLLNGSLDESERAEVREHVASCDSCRGELRQAVELWNVLDVHPSSMYLAWYAEDPSALDQATRAEVEEHLATCPECRALVDPASDAHRLVSPEPGEVPAVAEHAAPAAVVRRPAGRRAQRWLSLAASIAALTLLGALWLVAGSGVDDALEQQAAHSTTQGQSESLIRAMDWESGPDALETFEVTALEVTVETAPSPEPDPASGEASRGAVLSSFDFESGELPTGL